MGKKRYLINHQIRSSPVRLIDHQENHVGVVPLDEALRSALEAGLDLVEVDPTSDPHVCQICDAGKLSYKKAKQDRETKKKRRTVDLKEVRLTSRISDHDLQRCISRAIVFLERGDKVKFRLRFKGREMQHKDLGGAVLERVKEALSEYGVVESDIRGEGRSMLMVIAAK